MGNIVINGCCDKSIRHILSKLIERHDSCADMYSKNISAGNPEGSNQWLNRMNGVRDAIEIIKEYIPKED